MKPCVCGHAYEEHRPLCTGFWIDEDGASGSCMCIHYEAEQEYGR